MARSQKDDLLLFLLLLLCLGAIDCCYPASKQLHVCLNIYLERDFPIIETILKGQKVSGYREGRVILEGPDLENICNRIDNLQNCYRDLLYECNYYWQLNRYMQLMKSLNKAFFYLCRHNRTNNLRDILLNGACVRNAESQIGKCSEKSGINWFQTWKEILRLQVGPNERCPSLQSYKDCFRAEMKMVSCGKNAGIVYGNLLDLWLDTWCNVQLISVQHCIWCNAALKLTVPSTLSLFLVVMYLFLKNLLCL